MGSDEIEGGVLWATGLGVYNASGPCCLGWSRLRMERDADFPRLSCWAVVDVDSAMLAAEEAFPAVE